MQKSHIVENFGSNTSVIELNKVIRNTYALLAMTVVFSAISAAVSMAINLQIPPMIAFIGMFGLLFVTQALANSALGIICVFVFTGFCGLTLGPMLNYYMHNFSNCGQLIAASLGTTGAIFFGLSGYAMTTKKDFSYLGGFLFVGFTVAILASLIGMFFNVPAMHLAISCAIVLLSTGSILFETSLIINGGERNYIRATISIYVSLLNLFMSLLRIFSAFAGKRD